MLYEYGFKHGFFTKSSSEKYLSLLSSHFNKNYSNCFLNQIHSNYIVFGSRTQTGSKIAADGIVCDKLNQNLWIYTADCMPILVADKSKRVVAAVHCGRKGLEKKILKNLIKTFDILGSSRNDLLIAIGPSISKENYLVDKNTFVEFYKDANDKELTNLKKRHEIQLFIENLTISEKQDLIQIDLKKYAHQQLLNENIPSTNIEISSLCTYASDDKFYSWRKTKTTMRQWNFICS